MRWSLLFCLLLFTGLSWFVLFMGEMALSDHDWFGVFLVSIVYIASVHGVYKEIDDMITWDAVLKADYADNDMEKVVEE